MAAPRGQFGNRLDTEAGRAKEAQMAAAAHALQVAHSEAVHGRAESAKQALSLAQSHASGVNNAPAAFTQAVNRDVQNINALMPSSGGGGGGGGGTQIPQSSPTTSNPTPPTAKPADPWTRSSDYVGPKGIKQADPDVVLFDQESVSPELLIELEYESLAGVELINISRSDMIDGQQVVYSPIKNLSSIRRRFNPNNIISMPELSSSYFASFSIDLVLRGIRNPYFDTNGDLIIEIDEVLEDEIIEAEVDSSGTIDVVEFL
jgi:hypothetical protein